MTASARGALLAATAVFLAVWAWAWVVLPAEGVVHHVGLDGPTRTGSRGGILWVLLLTGPVLLLGLRWLVGLMVRHGDGTGLNYPHKAYWMAPERREEFFRRVRTDVDVLLSGVMLFLAVTVVEVVRTTRDPDAWSPVLPGVAVAAALLVTWVVWVHRRSRPPAGAQGVGRAER